MSNQRIILISGYARSGKDTLATSLVGQIYQTHGIETQVFKFADPLKRALKVALLEVGIDYIDPFTEDEETKKLLRPLMVEFGKYCRSLNKDVFVNATIREIERVRKIVNGPFIPVISDLRYLNEIQRVRSWASNQLSTTIVYRAHINRQGFEAANEEEARSIKELNFSDYPTSESHFPSNDIEGIKGCAKKLAIQACDGVKPIKTISHMELLKQMDKEYGTDHAEQFVQGCKLDPAKFAAYAQPNAGTKGWLERGMLEELEKHILALRPALERIEARLKRLEDEVDDLKPDKGDADCFASEHG